MPTPLPPDLGELWKALRNAWLNDPVISQLLSQANDGGSIYVEFPNQKISFPSMTMKPQNPDIRMDTTYLGVSHETLQVNAYSLDRYHGSQVFSAFQSGWSIPLNNAPEFQSVNWRITQMTWVHPIDLGQLQVSNIDQSVWGFACQARCYVRRRDS